MVTESPTRIIGIDVARALASILMIQGHAYDGWVTTAGKETFGYAITRFFGTLPLPAFLVLSGSALALRLNAGHRRGEHAREIRASIVRRGLEVVLWGYAVNLLYALMDGGLSITNVLRADVLSAIGWSIVVVGACAVRGPSTHLAWPKRAALVIGVVLTLVCPSVTQSTAHLTGPLAFIIAPFSEVEGITLMPMIPLIAWTCLGFLFGQKMSEVRSRLEDPSRRGAPRKWLFMMLALVVLVSLNAHLLTQWCVDQGADFSRQDPVIWLNVIDLGARGLAVLIGGVLFSDLLSGRALSLALTLGRGSLLAYVFHIPFCYGRVGSFVKSELSMTEATLGVFVLTLVSIFAVVFRDNVRRRVRQWRRDTSQKS